MVFHAPPAPESKWDVPAITAGTPQERNFNRAFGSRVRFPYRTRLMVDNHRGTATLTIRVNGAERTVGPRSTLKITAEEVGRIGHYTIDASADTGAGDVDVYENGGLTRGD